MQQHHSYHDLLEASRRVNWRIDDIIGGDKHLDFTRPFLPETFARVEALGFLAPAEKLQLNHVRARGYLAMFELVEQFIVPFISDQAVNGEAEDAYKASALRQFAREETKHRELFRRFLHEFDEGFGSECALIGPAEDIVKTILAHSALAVTITVLGLEWMSQGHYLESVQDDQALDPQFRSLLRHHWIEEAQHARLDGLMLRTMAAANATGDAERAVDEYFEIGAFFDGGFKAQASLDLEAFERAAKRTLSQEQRVEFLRIQHQAIGWTFLGSAMGNPNFLAEVEILGAEARSRIATAARAFTLQ
jgi:hypothetical protein